MQQPARYIALGRADCGRFESAVEKEWLVTNGLGGFGAGTVSGANTRRYHGLLVAALRPPLERTVLVAKIDAVAEYNDKSYPPSSSTSSPTALLIRTVIGTWKRFIWRA